MSQLPYLPRQPRSAYIDAPALLGNRPTAGERGWPKGWPKDCPPPGRRTELAIVRPLDGKVFRPEIITPLAVLFTEWADAMQEFGHPWIGADEVALNPRGRPIKQGGVGSFSCRAIKGTDDPRDPDDGVPSNHSSATAWDLWTRSNPMLVGRFPDGRLGRAVPFVSTIHPLVVELAAAADIFWGGWYWDQVHHRTGQHYYCDAMHFEYMRTPADVADSLRKLRLKVAEIRKRLHPTEPEVPDVDAKDVLLIQRTLNELGHQPPLVLDSDFGALTRAAVQGLPALVAQQVDLAEDAAKADTKAQALAALESVLG